jgi:hypothetical protein
MSCSIVSQVVGVVVAVFGVGCGSLAMVLGTVALWLLATAEVGAVWCGALMVLGTPAILLGKVAMVCFQYSRYKPPVVPQQRRQFLCLRRNEPSALVSRLSKMADGCGSTAFVFALALAMLLAKAASLCRSHRAATPLEPQYLCLRENERSRCKNACYASLAAFLAMASTCLLWFSLFLCSFILRKEETEFSDVETLPPLVPMEADSSLDVGAPAADDAVALPTRRVQFTGNDRVYYNLLDPVVGEVEERKEAWNGVAAKIEHYGETFFSSDPRGEDWKGGMQRDYKGGISLWVPTQQERRRDRIIASNVMSTFYGKENSKLMPPSLVCQTKLEPIPEEVEEAVPSIGTLVIVVDSNPYEDSEVPSKSPATPLVEEEASMCMKKIIMLLAVHVFLCMAAFLPSLAVFGGAAIIPPAPSLSFAALQVPPVPLSPNVSMIPFPTASSLAGSLGLDIMRDTTIHTHDGILPSFLLGYNATAMPSNSSAIIPVFPKISLNFATTRDLAIHASMPTPWQSRCSWTMTMALEADAAGPSKVVHDENVSLSFATTRDLAIHASMPTPWQSRHSWIMTMALEADAAVPSKVVHDENVSLSFATTSDPAIHASMPTPWQSRHSWIMTMALEADAAVPSKVVHDENVSLSFATTRDLAIHASMPTPWQSRRSWIMTMALEADAAGPSKVVHDENVSLSFATTRDLAIHASMPTPWQSRCSWIMTMALEADAAVPSKVVHDENELLFAQEVPAIHVGPAGGPLAGDLVVAFVLLGFLAQALAPATVRKLLICLLRWCHSHHGTRRPRASTKVPKSILRQPKYSGNPSFGPSEPSADKQKLDNCSKCLIAVRQYYHDNGSLQPYEARDEPFKHLTVSWKNDHRLVEVHQLTVYTPFVKLCRHYRPWPMFIPGAAKPMGYYTAGTSSHRNFLLAMASATTRIPKFAVSLRKSSTLQRRPYRRPTKYQMKRKDQFQYTLAPAIPAAPAASVVAATTASTTFSFGTITTKKMKSQRRSKRQPQRIAPNQFAIPAAPVVIPSGVFALPPHPEVAAANPEPMDVNMVEEPAVAAAPIVAIPPPAIVGATASTTFSFGTITTKKMKSQRHSKRQPQRIAPNQFTIPADPVVIPLGVFALPPHPEVAAAIPEPMDVNVELAVAAAPIVAIPPPAMVEEDMPAPAIMEEDQEEPMSAPAMMEEDQQQEAAPMPAPAIVEEEVPAPQRRRRRQPTQPTRRSERIARLYPRRSKRLAEARSRQNK